MNKIIILGSGTSTGIPMIGCKCQVCSSKDKKNKRLRTSIILKTENKKTILIDTTPDLRTQLLNNQIDYIDFAIITHDHADHLHGIDDLRPLCFSSPPKTIDVFASKQTANQMAKRFEYIFLSEKVFTKKKPIMGGGIPRLKLKTLEIKNNATLKKRIQNEHFEFFFLPHGHKQTVGFLHKKFAYLTDCQSIPEQIVSKLKKAKLELILIGCVQQKYHDTHLYIKNCFDYIKKMAPKQAGIIHMNHNLDHGKLLTLAKNSFSFPVFPVYDNQILSYS